MTSFNQRFVLFIESCMDSVTTLIVSSVFTCFLCSLTAINGTTGFLLSTISDAKLKVSKPPKAIPFLRSSTASGIVFASSKCKYSMCSDSRAFP